MTRVNEMAGGGEIKPQRVREGGPIWWAIINVVIVELGLVIPPIGLVILIINAMRPDIPLRALYRNVGPFVAADLVVLAFHWRCGCRRSCVAEHDKMKRKARE